MKLQTLFLTIVSICSITNASHAGTKKFSCLEKTRDLSEVKAIWSPDGRYIAAISKTSGDYTTNIRKSINGENILTLKNVSNVAWDPDLKGLLGVKHYDANSDKTKIIYFNLDGKKGKVVAMGTKPLFSDDGKRIAFVQDKYVWVTNFQDGHQRKISQKQRVKIHISWAGKDEVYYTGDGCVWRGDVKTAKEIRFIQEVFMKYYFTGLSVSPDKMKMILMATGAQVAGGGDDTIWTVNLNQGSKSLARVTKGQYASWYPDSRHLVYQYKGNIHKIAIDGGKARKLTRKRKYLNNTPSLNEKTGKCCFISTRNDYDDDGIIDWNDKPDIWIINTSTK